MIGDQALKKAIEELEITEEQVSYDCGCASLTGVSQYLDRPDVLDLIDNAPTVEERQQGEWIKYSFKDFGAFGDYDYKCSNCQKVSGGQYNFCSNCGADMRGGLKNDRE